MTSAMWYAARGTGLTALILITMSLALGISARARRPFLGLPRFALASLHRNVSLLATALLALHVGTLMLDPYAQLKLVNLVLPFSSTYRPLWVGLGTLSLDILVALIVTSLLRERIGHRAWRFVHWAAYAMWPTALVHALGSGTDSGTTWLRGVAALCTFVVVAALAWRFTFPPTEAVRTVRRPTPEMAR
jgi:methionine sulfoxide reductase heme-binding subunit